MKRVCVAGAFDNVRAREVRFLQEAARLGGLRVILWDDEEIERRTGARPKFPVGERRYFLEALRFVDGVSVVGGDADEARCAAADIWVAGEGPDLAAQREFCRARGIEYRIILDASLAGFPDPAEGLMARPAGAKRVIVTGCYDWFHSGHVRFFEEVAALGDLYVVVGHDANIRLLKGEGHPLFSQDERRYLAGAVRHVREALISSGDGWLDAEPEIARIRPHIYAVNEDGDRPEKRAFCEANGIEYAVLRRLPAPGLPRRSSTDLRGY